MLLRVLLAWSVVSTAIHYTHNFVAIEDYPQASWLPNSAVQVAIVVLWPLFTVLAVVAYRRWSRGERRGLTTALLAIYSVAGLSSLGHFAVDGVDLAWPWIVSIASDGAAGAAVLAFAVWSELTPAPARRAERRSDGLETA